MTLEEFQSEAEQRFGGHENAWTFTCPACGTDQSIAMYKNAWLEGHSHYGSMYPCLGYMCIGTLTGQRHAGIEAHARGEKWDKGCNFRFDDDHPNPPIEVLMPNGERRPSFEFAKRFRLPAFSQ
jgi:hypothetical protein